MLGEAINCKINRLIYYFVWNRNPLFDVPVKRKPAPRLFCDICDIFDAHDTEDCPVQSGGSPTHAATINASEQKNNGNEEQPKKRVLPPPRKYCENCEGTFNHPVAYSFKCLLNHLRFSLLILQFSDTRLVNVM